MTSTLEIPRPSLAATNEEALALQRQLDPRMDELAALILRLTPGDGLHSTAIPRLQFARATGAQLPTCGVFQPSLCIIAQGRKQVTLNDESYVYDRSRYIVGSVDLPVSGQVIGATEAAPYVSLRLEFDPHQIAELVLDMNLPAPLRQAAGRGLFLEDASVAMADTALRLVRLLETPEDIPALAPLAERELLYRLLRGPQGWRVVQATMADSHAQRIARAIRWLNSRFTEPLRIEDMARAVNMSSSSLHHHFKAVTAMSPLQYQKRLRLQEARRLLLSESLDAATAGHRVGYESPSQFSREYGRLFGTPPARDLQRLRLRHDDAALVAPPY